MCSWAAQQDQHVWTSTKPSAVTLLRLYVGAPKHTHTCTDTQLQTHHAPVHPGVRISPVKHRVLSDQQIPNHSLNIFFLSPAAGPSSAGEDGGKGGGAGGESHHSQHGFMSGSLQMPVNLTFCQLWEAVLRSAGSLLGDGAFRKINPYFRMLPRWINKGRMHFPKSWIKVKSSALTNGEGRRRRCLC